MKKSILKALESSIKGNVYSKNEFLNYYSVDASSYQILPKAIVIPINEKDVINTVKIAKKFKTSVTVRGAGTGLVGSALNNGIIIDMKNFDSFRLEKNFAIVGPGITKGQLDKKLEKSKKFFPPNPSIGSYCLIGGMLGNNSSGSRSLKYGSVIDNVKEITFVNGEGKKITLPENKKISKKVFGITQKRDNKKIPNVTKNSSGYRIDKIKSINDSHKIILGSEGTLGIILSAKIKIKNNPKKRIPHVIEDAAVSLEKLPKLFSVLNKLNRKYKTKAIAYGHAGNGNIHIRLVSERKKKSLIKKIATEYFKEIIKLGGTITAEHGDGLARS